MVLGEFTEEEKKIIYADKNIRQIIINEIKKHINDDELEFTDDMIINLALEYLLDTLDDKDKSISNGTLFNEVQEFYLMANMENIKNEILKK